MASGKTHEMPIPPRAGHVSVPVEIARVWATDGELHVSLNASVWEDPAAWGIMLVELARSVARAYEQNRGTPQPQALTRLREGFDAEWANPTDEPHGPIQR